MNLILLEPDEATHLDRVIVTGARATHLRTVLGVAPGDVVRIGVIDGPCGEGTVLAMDATTVHLRCALQPEAPATPNVDLLLALPRPKVLRRLWAQLAAMGVGRIRLTNAARVERNYFDTHLLQADVYRPLLVEGLQQARDTRLPLVTVHRQLKVFLEDELELHTDEVRAYGDPNAGPSIHAAVRARNAHRVLLAVGPEGGWTDYERELLARHGFEAVTMGPRTLRSDTACVSLLALTHDALRSRQDD